MKKIIILFLFSINVYAEEISVSKAIIAVEANNNKNVSYDALHSIYFSYFYENKLESCYLQDILITNSCNNKNSAFSDGVHVFSDSISNTDGLNCSHKKLSTNKYELTFTNDLIKYQTNIYKFIIENEKVIGFQGSKTYLNSFNDKYETANLTHLGNKYNKFGRHEIPTNCKTINLYDDFEK